MVISVKGRANHSKAESKLYILSSYFVFCTFRENIHIGPDLASKQCLLHHQSVAVRDHASIPPRSPNHRPFREQGLHHVAPSHLVRPQDRGHQAAHRLVVGKREMGQELEEIEARAPQERCRVAEAETDLHDATENEAIPEAIAAAHQYRRAQR